MGPPCFTFTDFRYVANGERPKFFDSEIEMTISPLILAMTPSHFHLAPGYVETPHCGTTAKGRAFPYSDVVRGVDLCPFDGLRKLQADDNKLRKYEKS